VGYGDEIMSTGQARRLAEANPGHKVVIGPEGGIAAWSSMFDNVPFIARTLDEEQLVWLEDYTGHRPYIDYARTTNDKMVYTAGFKAEPGYLVVSALEWRWQQHVTRGEPYILIEPNTKGTFGDNKTWPWENWQKLADMLAGLPLVQIGPVGNARGDLNRNLKGVRRIVTQNPRQMVAMAEGAHGAITTDGALHHAMAAFGKPAVVIWGGRTDPAILGYDFHTNLVGTDQFCGSIAPCEHCRKAMSAIGPTQVADAVRTAISTSASSAPAAAALSA
jgi:hypothetical protein